MLRIASASSLFSIGCVRGLSRSRFGANDRIFRRNADSDKVSPASGDSVINIKYFFPLLAIRISSLSACSGASTYCDDPSDEHFTIQSPGRISSRYFGLLEYCIHATLVVSGFFNFFSAFFSTFSIDFFSFSEGVISRMPAFAYNFASFMRPLPFLCSPGVNNGGL